MSTAGRNATPAPAASDLAAALGDAGFVRLLARPDGDGVAATGVLASALAESDTPFQASVLDPLAPAVGSTEADYTVAVGHLDVAADAAVAADVAASAPAFDVAGELATGSGDASTGPDPILALAGTVAADAVVPPVVEAAEAAGVERRPGVALPVVDPVEGLAHSTLLHAPFSGDVATARAAIDGLDLPTGADEARDDALDDPLDDPLDETDRRRLASLVALDATDADGTNERAAESIERALRPHAGGPFETVGGFADVLDAAARERPGVALALALGDGGDRVRADAREAWRGHGAAAHAALFDGETARHDGLFVVRARSMPVGTVARLAAAFRSPEPIALAVADGEAAIHAVGERDVVAPFEDALDRLDGTAIGTGTRARGRFEAGDDWTDAADALVGAVREAL